MPHKADCGWDPLLLGDLDSFDPDARGAPFVKAEPLRRAPAQVDEPRARIGVMPARKRPTIVDPDDDIRSVHEVRDFDMGGKREMLVRRGEAARDEGFAVRRHVAALLPEGLLAVPGG